MDISNIAFVHDWLVDYGGAERCLEAMRPSFPDAPVHTLFHDPRQFEGTGIAGADIRTTFLDRPFFRKRYRNFLPLFPFAVEQLDVGDAEIVLSFSHSVGKGVLTRADTLHVCYCHTPVRYAWDLYHRYLKLSGLERGIRSWVARLILHYIRLWDAGTAHRVDAYIANSRYVAARIRKTYGREAAVIHPPVDVGRFAQADSKEDHYLMVGRMVPYKRMDLAVRACTTLKLPLRIVGGGPQFEELRALAGPTVTFAGRLSDAEVAREMAGAKAFLFPGEEDFGITPVEAQAAGTPVVAFGKGGSLETVVPPEGEDYSRATGLFFAEPSEESLVECLRRFEKEGHRFEPAAVVSHARGFATERYVKEMNAFLKREWEAFREAP